MYECQFCGSFSSTHRCPGPSAAQAVVPVTDATAELLALGSEPFVSFDLEGAGLSSVDVRPSAVVAVETDAKFPGTCVLRMNPNLWYRVDADVTDVLAALGATNE